MVKNLPANAGGIRDMGSVSALGRPPGGGNGNPLQSFRLGILKDRGPWRATVHNIAESDTTEVT